MSRDPVMATSRLVLHSAILLTACVVGFVMGRQSAVVVPSGNDKVLSESPRADWPVRAPVFDFDAIPKSSDARVDSISNSGSSYDQGPNRQFIPDPAVGDRPGPFIGPGSAEPIRGAAAATTEQIRALIEREMPDASRLDKSVWAEQLEGMSLDSALELLLLKQALGPLESLFEPSEFDPDGPDSR
jgi:hypothetical protein